MFLTADSGLNILNGEAFFEDKSRNESYIWKGLKDKDIGEGVYNLYGVGKDGFDIISNQFQYITLNKSLNFVQNVSENCKKWLFYRHVMMVKKS